MKTNPCSITRFNHRIATPLTARPCRFAHPQFTLCRLRFAISWFQVAIAYQLFAIGYLRFAIGKSARTLMTIKHL